jgi:hypothetical protein
MDKVNELPIRTYMGSVSIAGKELGCAVLDNGTRVLTSTSIFKAFDRPRRGKSVGDQRAENMPSFIDANNLKPFTNAVFRGGPESYEVVYTSKNGKAVYKGYNAEILPLICEVYLKARDEGILTDSQKPLAIASDILMRSLAKVGIIALIDEATGYQEDRDRDELQRILAAYISAELLPWARHFPDDFYIEMFRLKGWEYHGRSKPAIVGKITNELIYEHLPDGVLEELRNKNPVDSETKRRKHRHHQYLTEGTGIPNLDKQIVAVTTLMKISDSWQEFEKLFNKNFNLNQQLGFEDVLPNNDKNK